MSATEDFAKQLAKHTSVIGQMSSLSRALQDITLPVASQGLLSAFKDLTWTRSAAWSLESSLSRAAKDLQSSLAVTFPYQSALQALARPIGIQLSSYQDLLSPVARAVSALQASLATPTVLPHGFPELLSMPSISGVMGAVAAMQAPRAMATRASAISEEIASVREVADEPDFDEIERHFERIEAGLLARIRQIPKLRISFEGWLNLLLTVFVFLYTTIASDQFQSKLEGKVDAIARLDERILETQKRVYDSLMQHMKEADMTGTFYVVLRQARLATEPTLD